MVVALHFRDERVRFEKGPLNLIVGLSVQPISIAFQILQIFYRSLLTRRKACPDNLYLVNDFVAKFTSSLVQRHSSLLWLLNFRFDALEQLLCSLFDTDVRIYSVNFGGVLDVLIGVNQRIVIR